MLTPAERLTADRESSNQARAQRGWLSDLTSADCHQLATDRDPAASGVDLGTGSDPDVPDRSRDVDQGTAPQRVQAADARLDAASTRDATADARDLVALARDKAADERTLAVTQRDASYEHANGERSVTGAEIVMRAAGVRKPAAWHRGQSAEQRALAINDSEGHLAGDRLLRRVVQVIGKQLRPYDLVIRLGGDEFLFAMSNMTLVEARQRFSVIAASLGAGPAGDALSVGFAEFAPDETATQLIARADSELTARRHSNHDSRTHAGEDTSAGKA